MRHRPWIPNRKGLFSVAPVKAQCSAP
jgi:hypothetical protein